MPRQWNGSEWVTFEKVQPGMQLHHDEKGAHEHNKNLKKKVDETDLVETETDPIEEISEKQKEHENVQSKSEKHHDKQHPTSHKGK